MLSHPTSTTRVRLVIQQQRCASTESSTQRITIIATLPRPRRRQPTRHCGESHWVTAKTCTGRAAGRVGKWRGCDTEDQRCVVNSLFGRREMSPSIERDVNEHAREALPESVRGLVPALVQTRAERTRQLSRRSAARRHPIGCEFVVRVKRPIRTLRGTVQRLWL